MTDLLGRDRCDNRCDRRCGGFDDSMFFFIILIFLCGDGFGGGRGCKCDHHCR